MCRIERSSGGVKGYNTENVRDDERFECKAINKAHKCVRKMCVGIKCST